MKISECVIFYFHVVLLHLVFCSVVALASIGRSVVFLLECLLDVVFGANCLLSLLALESFFLLNFDSDFVGSEPLEPFLLRGG